MRKTISRLKLVKLGRFSTSRNYRPKKYRRVSRKSRKQSLHELRYDLPESVDELENIEDFEADWD